MFKTICQKSLLNWRVTCYEWVIFSGTGISEELGKKYFNQFLLGTDIPNTKLPTCWCMST